MLDTLRESLVHIAIDVIVPSLDASRWTVLRPTASTVVIGLAVGRRLIKHFGVVGLLVLQPDNSFRPLLVPIEGEEIPSLDEEAARDYFVRANKQGYAQRGHDFESSPVYPSRCAICAEEEPHHDRERVEVLVRRVLGTLDVEITFTGRTSHVSDIKVRTDKTLKKPKMNPVPGTEPEVPSEDDSASPVKALYRSLSDEERASVIRSIEAERGLA